VDWAEVVEETDGREVMAARKTAAAMIARNGFRFMERDSATAGQEREGHWLQSRVNWLQTRRRAARVRVRCRE